MVFYRAINTTTSSSLPTTTTSSASSSSTSSGSNQGLAPSSNTPLSKQSHSGVIIGVTVSAAVLLIAALLLGWLLKRRKRYDAPATSDPIPPPMTSALESRAFQVQSLGLTSPGLSGVSNSQLVSLRHGTVLYGTAGSSNMSSAIAGTSGVDSSRRKPVPSTNLSTASAGTSRNQLDGDDSPDDAPPAYDELGARTSMRIGGRKARILAQTRP